MDEAAHAHAPTAAAKNAGEAPQILVLTHPAAPVPAKLMQALQRRGSRVQLVTDAPMLMAELAFAQRPVVIINQTQRFAHLSQLLAAMTDYHPQVDCWGFDEHTAAHAPRFVPLTGTHAAAPQPLKMHPTEEPADEDTEPLLTAEELAMLLGHSHTDGAG